MNKTTRNLLKFKTKTKNARFFVNKFPINILKSMTFLHPVGVCGWTFHRTVVVQHLKDMIIPLAAKEADIQWRFARSSFGIGILLRIFKA